jgi:hypothetical protein
LNKFFLSNEKMSNEPPKRKGAKKADLPLEEIDRFWEGSMDDDFETYSGQFLFAPYIEPVRSKIIKILYSDKICYGNFGEKLRYVMIVCEAGTVELLCKHEFTGHEYSVHYQNKNAELEEIQFNGNVYQLREWVFRDTDTLRINENGSIIETDDFKFDFTNGQTMSAIVWPCDWQN